MCLYRVKQVQIHNSCEYINWLLFHNSRINQNEHNQCKGGWVGWQIRVLLDKKSIDLNDLLIRSNALNIRLPHD